MKPRHSRLANSALSGSIRPVSFERYLRQASEQEEIHGGIRMCIRTGTSALTVNNLLRSAVAVVSALILLSCVGCGDPTVSDHVISTPEDSVEGASLNATNPDQQPAAPTLPTSQSVTQQAMTEINRPMFDWDKFTRPGDVTDEVAPYFQNRQLDFGTSRITASESVKLVKAEIESGKLVLTIQLTQPGQHLQFDGLQGALGTYSPNQYRPRPVSIKAASHEEKFIRKGLLRIGISHPQPEKIQIASVEPPSQLETFRQAREMMKDVREKEAVERVSSAAAMAAAEKSIPKHKQNPAPKPMELRPVAAQNLPKLNADGDLSALVELLSGASFVGPVRYQRPYNADWYVRATQLTFSSDQTVARAAKMTDAILDEMKKVDVVAAQMSAASRDLVRKHLPNFGNIVEAMSQPSDDQLMAMRRAGGITQQEYEELIKEKNRLQSDVVVKTATGFGHAMLNSTVMLNAKYTHRVLSNIIAGEIAVTQLREPLARRAGPLTGTAPLEFEGSPVGVEYWMSFRCKATKPLTNVTVMAELDIGYAQRKTCFFFPELKPGDEGHFQPINMRAETPQEGAAYQATKDRPQNMKLAIFCDQLQAIDVVPHASTPQAIRTDVFIHAAQPGARFLADARMMGNFKLPPGKGNTGRNKRSPKSDPDYVPNEHYTLVARRIKRLKDGLQATIEITPPDDEDGFARKSETYTASFIVPEKGVGLNVLNPGESLDFISTEIRVGREIVKLSITRNIDNTLGWIVSGGLASGSNAFHHEADVTLKSKEIYRAELQLREARKLVAERKDAEARLIYEKVIRDVPGTYPADHARKGLKELETIGPWREKGDRMNAEEAERLRQYQDEMKMKKKN